MTKIKINGEDVTLFKDEGVLKKILREGTGAEKPFKGDTCYVHYDGQLLDSKKFDSSRDGEELFSFKVGEGSVIKGWDLGIPTMKKGELSRFIIKPEYGYGAKGSPPAIPANATLVFDIELFDFEGEELSENKEKSVFRRIIKKGSGFNCPNNGSRVTVDIKGYDINHRIFDERKNIEFDLGDGVRFNIVEGIEIALTKFKKDEYSIITIKSRRGWGTEGNTKFNIPPNSDVTYEVCLKKFEKLKEAWELNSSEKLKQAEIMKSKGNELLVEKYYYLAVKKYQKILEYLKGEIYDLEEEQSLSKKLQLAAHLNLAVGFLKLKEYSHSFESCEKALVLEPKNEKGLFRMGQSYSGMGKQQEAIDIFKKVLELNPSNSDASNQILLCKQKLKEISEKEKEYYTKMFGPKAN